jgi:hypothetical protein
MMFGLGPKTALANCRESFDTGIGKPDYDKKGDILHPKYVVYSGRTENTRTFANEPTSVEIGSFFALSRLCITCERSVVEALFGFRPALARQPRGGLAVAIERRRAPCRFCERITSRPVLGKLARSMPPVRRERSSFHAWSRCSPQIRSPQACRLKPHH